MQSDLFRCQIVTVRCNEIFCFAGTASDRAAGFSGLVHTGTSETDRRVMKDMTVLIDIIFCNIFQLGIVPDPACKTLSLIPQTAKEIMALTP